MRSVTALAIAASLWAPAVFADDMQACSDAYTQAQVSRKDRKLLDAREQLRTCSQMSCPGFIHKDCAQWLDEVQASLPSVVAVAQDDAGTNLVDVAVSLDGKALASSLDGRAIEVDPGPHTFTFVTTDGVKAETQVLVVEAERDKRVVVTIHRPRAIAPPAAVVPEARPGGSTWRTVGWILGGAGVVGLGVAAAFGVSAMEDKSNADCVSTGAKMVCKPGTVPGIKSAALTSDVAWVAGGVLVAGGAGLLLFAPRSGAALKIMPVVTGSSGQILAVGSF